MARLQLYKNKPEKATAKKAQPEMGIDKIPNHVAKQVGHVTRRTKKKS